MLIDLMYRIAKGYIMVYYLISESSSRTATNLCPFYKLLKMLATIFHFENLL